MLQVNLEEEEEEEGGRGGQNEAPNWHLSLPFGSSRAYFQVLKVYSLTLPLPVVCPGGKNVATNSP
jgi:hypothetical protein